MRARVQANGPCMENVEVKIEITMPIRHWRKVIDQMSIEQHPSWELRQLITNAVGSVLRSVETIVAGKDSQADE